MTTAPRALVELAMPVRGMTCTNCSHHVRSALESVSGVSSARVELTAGLAKVSFDPTRATVATLQNAVEAAGYVPGEPVGITDSLAAGDRSRDRPTPVVKPALGRPVVVGFLASSLLVAFYAGIVTAAQGLDHAAGLLLQDWYFVLPIVVAFGVQVGLFVHLRISSQHQSTRSARALTGVGTGTSSVSMVACCAHHLTDILPLIGISGAALFLNDYRQPLMLVGIATNLVGIALMVRMMRRMRRPGIDALHDIQPRSRSSVHLSGGRPPVHDEIVP